MHPLEFDFQNWLELQLHIPAKQFKPNATLHAFAWVHA
jgi:hypothetical protein